MRTKDYYEKKIAAYGNISEYESIICPHCFEVEDDPMAFSLDDDGDFEEDVVCEKCGQKFDIKVRVEKTYTTKKSRKDDD